MQEKLKLERYKAAGLNEYGQTKEEAERSEKIKVLVEKRNKVLDQIAAIDLEISYVNSPPIVVPEVSQRTRKGK